MKIKKHVLVVGAGLFGLTIAERCANFGAEVMILEKRNHIGGNAFTYFDDRTGVNVHKYGSHIFHTNNESVWRFVNRFSKFNEYQHQVLARFKDSFYPIPVNLLTISSFFGKALSPDEARVLISEKTLPFQFQENPSNLYEKGIKTLGKDLFEAFFANYTKKQWEVEASTLPASIISRIPVRYDFENRYFTDKYQGIPVDGYTPLCERMIDHHAIKINLNVDYMEVSREFGNSLVIYTGPIDQIFEYQHGMLNWRTIDLEFEHKDVEDFQGMAVLNFPESKYKYTRIHEFKHLHPETIKDTRGTIIAREYSRVAGERDEPFYPVNTEEDRRMLAKYREMAEEKSEHMLIGGRLGSYQYLDMHMAIASALSMFENRVREQLLLN